MRTRKIVLLTSANESGGRGLLKAQIIYPEPSGTAGTADDASRHILDAPERSHRASPTGGNDLFR